MKRRVALAGAVVVACGGLAFAPAAPASVGARVKATNFVFTSETVKIHKGDKVVWKFKQGKHNVKGKGFKSPVMRSGKYKHKFNKVGTFKYHCTIHPPDMKGVVKVVK